ncbi:MAG: heat-shock protein Hsp20 [Porticoccaceae bacterium]|nr:heat-shock protein Hsp20 [Porticoccaceae bacterium]
MSLIPRGSFFDVDKFFDDFWSPATQRGSNVGAFFTPRVDIKEHDGHYEISAELPGVKKEDLHITLEEGILTIEAESRQESKEEKEGRVIRQERRYGKFTRSFNLGGNVSEEDISANFDNGILTITAPKVPEVTPQQRRIEVK